MEGKIDWAQQAQEFRRRRWADDSSGVIDRFYDASDELLYLTRGGHRGHPQEQDQGDHEELDDTFYDVDDAMARPFGRRNAILEEEEYDGAPVDGPDWHNSRPQGEVDRTQWELRRAGEDVPILFSL